MRPLLHLLPLLMIAAAARADYVRVELVADRTAATPNSAINVAVVLHVDPGWHVYWLNPGDAGAPPKMKWDLPAGVAAATLAYPVPKRIDVGNNLTAFGYENEVALLTIVSFSGDVKDAVELKGTLSCVVCSDECILERHPVALRLPVGPGTAKDAERFQAWQSKNPQLVSGGIRPANFGPDGKQGSIDYVLEAGVEPVDFFPPPTDFATFDKPVVVQVDRRRIYRVPFRLFGQPRIGDRPGAIVVTRTAAGETKAAEVQYAFRADDPAVRSN